MRALSRIIKNYLKG